MAVESRGAVESVYAERRVFPPPRQFMERARIKSLDEYRAMYRRSIEDPHGFGGEMA